MTPFLMLALAAVALWFWYNTTKAKVAASYNTPQRRRADAVWKVSLALMEAEGERCGKKFESAESKLTQTIALCEEHQLFEHNIAAFQVMSAIRIDQKRFDDARYFLRRAMELEPRCRQLTSEQSLNLKLTL